jgi:hypothetical protein
MKTLLAIVAMAVLLAPSVYSGACAQAKSDPKMEQLDQEKGKSGESKSKAETKGKSEEKGRDHGKTEAEKGKGQDEGKK